MKKLCIFIYGILLLASACQQRQPAHRDEITFPEENAKPWVYWYCMQGVVISRE